MAGGERRRAAITFTVCGCPFLGRARLPALVQPEPLLRIGANLVLDELRVLRSVLVDVALIVTGANERHRARRARRRACRPGCDGRRWSVPRRRCAGRTRPPPGAVEARCPKKSTKTPVLARVLVHEHAHQLVVLERPQAGLRGRLAMGYLHARGLPVREDVVGEGVSCCARAIATTGKPSAARRAPAISQLPTCAVSRMMPLPRASAGANVLAPA